MRNLLTAALLLCACAARAQAWAWDDGSVPFVVTPDEIVERMMRMAEVKPGDTLVDLGAGDGRIVIAAAKRGAQGLGVDLDPELVKLATENARQAGVAANARFEVRDLFDTDLSKASVVAFYLLPEFNAKLLPRLLALKPGTRIVSHDGGIGDWPPDERLEMRVPEKAVGVGGLSRVELWIVPARAEGQWLAEVPQHGGRWTFRIAQRFQELETEVRAEGRDLLVHASRLRGSEIKLAVTGIVGTRAWNHLFEGQIEEGRIVGHLRVSDGNKTRTYPWTATRAP
ncbi:MAG: class I SAM-dependent methyltransferase [Betaproteobacteria bacterium]|nr:class I SAM-dependent methyltransferase [Betaproteobacteria bacterium]MDH5221175.1 class I SAM-dependent methyltransferase [Betaproteobacteria bacterium]MDH5351584.1 class I SAM-dependent methyltransferase [Betaproteobacteria bacterium]